MQAVLNSLVGIMMSALAQEWTQTNEANVKKLTDAASYIQSIFRDYAAHNVQDAFHLQKTTVVQNGLSKAEWKHKEVSRLLKDLRFLSTDTRVTKYLF